MTNPELILRLVEMLLKEKEKSMKVKEKDEDQYIVKSKRIPVRFSYFFIL